MSGRLGTNRLREFRERIVEAMPQDLIDRHNVEAYRERMASEHEKSSNPQKLEAVKTQEISENELAKRDGHKDQAEGSQMLTGTGHMRGQL